LAGALGSIGDADSATASGSHIGVLYIVGDIEDEGDTYNQQYALETVEGMMNNDSNEGLMLYVNSPGGEVSPSDELYLKIMEYKKKTGRPVYAYFDDEAASGAYYISSAADQILMNRNGWTGSIGVTIGTFFDYSDLLEKYGVKSYTITSGANKAMGNGFTTITDEQRKILQGLVDDSYEQFVEVVADGRNMTTDQVKKIADGRLYTPKQAEENGLIDKIVKTYDEAIEEMKKAEDLEDCQVYEYAYEYDETFLDTVLEGVSSLRNSLSANSDLGIISKLMDKSASGNDFTLQYKCEVSR
jgi:protease-4